MARQARTPKESGASPAAWPWWVEAQVSFHSGDLEAVGAAPGTFYEVERVRLRVAECKGMGN